MNRYASLARQHWETYWVDELARIKDRDTFFAQLGEQISYQIAELTRELQRGSPPDEAYLAKAERFRRARQVAEEQILRDTLIFPAGQNP